MPKHMNPRPPRKQGPYQIPSHHSNVGPSNNSRQYWTIPTPMLAGGPMPLHNVNNLSLTMPAHVNHIHSIPPTPKSPTKAELSQVTTGPWPASSDELLLSLRAQALNWAEIQRHHFPTKSANACRKRYERILAKQRGAHEWNDEKMLRLSRGYRDMRKQIWTPLAEYMGCGESWENVERKVRLSRILDRDKD